MVRALLEGRKTQTRRVLKHGPHGGWHIYHEGKHVGWSNGGGGMTPDQSQSFYAPGDRLYVREALDLGAPTNAIGHATYTADGADVDLRPTGAAFWASGYKRRAVPSIHMPRWASRLTLTVTDVRVQRLQEISEADAVAEGCEAYRFPGPWWQGYRDMGDGDLLHQQVIGDAPPDWMIEPHRMRDSTHLNRSAVNSFTILWNSLHGPGAWAANPWIVALTFTVQHGNIDQLAVRP